MTRAAAPRAALAGACVVLASCALRPVTPPAALDFRPAPRSTLVSGELQFLVAESRHGAQTTTVLARRQAGAAAQVVARLVQLRQGAELQVAILPLPESEGAQARADHEVAALAQLYTLVLRQDPLARYCLGSGGQPCDAARDGISHAQALQALAQARDRAAVDIPAVVPWRVVEMRAAPTRSWDVDVVAVRATSRQAPLQGLAIHFNRAPHSLCTARTGADGVASCRLVDQHGDEHEHDHSAPVVATFPGDRRQDAVLPPTTYVLPTASALRPLTLPPGRP